MADQPTTTPAPELPKPRRFLTADEAVEFLGLRSKTSLVYLHSKPDGPPFVRLTARRRVYDLADLQAWAETRKTNQL
jgi:predicted DNA-binding transcriptional regulator AlpA